MLLTLMRTLHYGAMVSLAGTLLFEVYVAGPASRRLGDDLSLSFWRLCRRLTLASAILGILSGLLWLFFEASAMSGKPLALVFSQGIVPVVLGRTRFGHDWLLRGVLTLPLIACLVARRRSATSSKVLAGTALALAAAELVTIAGAGHAAAGTGSAGTLQLLADGAHLLAAGAWIGGLLPFAWLFAAVRRASGALAADAAYDGAIRFSRIGLLAVATLLLTGSVNSIFLVGSIPALLGTDYGHLLLVKLALFLTMVAFAAINRLWLVPQLAWSRASSLGARRDDLVAHIQRNALIEAGLGLLVLVLVGALGTKPPALHIQPQWPLPFRVSLATLAADPAARVEALAAVVLALAGIGLFLYGVVRVHQRTLHVLLGLFLALAVGWWPFRFIIVPAYPTTFFSSTVPFTASSIAHGGAVFAEHCASCHGVSGRGDGPLAGSAPVRPADLTAAHIFEHSDGDLFWWISNGIPAGGMPGFAAQLDERERWAVINFIHARASAHQATLEPAVTSAPLAPEFSFTRNGIEETLRHAREQGPVLIVFYQIPGSRPRLDELAGAEGALAASGLRLVAVTDDRAAQGAGWSGSAQPDFIVDADKEAAAAYALFAGSSRFDHCEFLIDRAGFLRARWCADLPGGMADARSLATAAEQVAAVPLEAPAHAHVHAHSGRD